MANILAYGQALQQGLDKQVTQELLTGWMDSNAKQIKYTGGKEVKIGKLSTDGLGDYARGSSDAYVNGDVKFEYETKVMTQDRGRKFTLDSMDVDETNFLVTATNIMGEFQRLKVIPEIDAYRLSKLATTAMNVAGDTNVEYGYTVNSSTIINKIKAGIKVIRENGYNGPLVCHLNYDSMFAVEEKVLEKLSSVTFIQGGIETQVPSIDGCPLIKTPQNRMYSSIILNDGTSSNQTEGGYSKGTKAIDANFIIAPIDVPIAVTKQDKMRIFDPDTNQTADGWSMDYRRYHELWVLDNKVNSVYANFKDAKPTA
ncbi:hypothetical protein QCH13_003833 [Clostridioides difficile]|uniref:hypothetical protein n=1 Tax=unclassified Clostridioides TaxID=2635829 RepID=UPI0006BBC536|nr:hypothetical protein [Clostridioides difficile]KPI46589.1 prophage protein [Clostridioides difficile]MCC0658535.1 hypothetical protein [Clostridioides sp. ES-S-0123-01]MCC0765092.1 hypothetical protein [Clostridioides sp. ES-S-0006-03]UDN56661.1 hypothetical protein JJC01_10665 [Clostridioides sp. ES-S-0010-02]